MKEQKELYTKDDLKMMRAAEDSLLMGQNRVAELMKFAENSGIKRIGIAHCIGMTREANQLKQRLSEKFDVYTVDCKYGKIPAAELLDDENVRGTSCNPAGQADFLADKNTNLNISFGLCMGHDIMFNMKSKAPTTTLIVKDRENKHNTYHEFLKSK
ncbi:putative metal-binding protein [uncultured Paludibacter sp.]|uniref:Putative metal-binding protein n=1 Tax=uncultured Paludibacter sp. TaxID=497635 RepID=A0A653A6P6_9BACT|nr:putative metal-binding protein [uncultured Paludibacter sp.]